MMTGGTTSKVLEVHDSESCFSYVEDEEQRIGAAAAVGDSIVTRCVILQMENLQVAVLPPLRFALLLLVSSCQ